MSGSYSCTMARLLRSIFFVLSEGVMFQNELPLIHPCIYQVFRQTIKKATDQAKTSFFPLSDAYSCCFSVQFQLQGNIPTPCEGY